MALLIEDRALLIEYRALLIEYRALLIEDRALLIEYRALVGKTDIHSMHPCCNIYVSVYVNITHIIYMSYMRNIIRLMHWIHTCADARGNVASCICNIKCIGTTRIP